MEEEIFTPLFVGSGIEATVEVRKLAFRMASVWIPAMITILPTVYPMIGTIQKNLHCPNFSPLRISACQTLASFPT